VRWPAVRCTPALFDRRLRALTFTSRQRAADWSSSPAHGDAMDFTAAVLVEVTLRLARGDGPPGAYTPAAAFGPGIAADAGGTFFAHPANS
jgi:hypothetical protein